VPLPEWTRHIVLRGIYLTVSIPRLHAGYPIATDLADQDQSYNREMTLVDVLALPSPLILRWTGRYRHPLPVYLAPGTDRRER
jgi:hypothetical protein